METQTTVFARPPTSVHGTDSLDNTIVLIDPTTSLTGSGAAAAPPTLKSLVPEVVVGTPTDDADVVTAFNNLSHALPTDVTTTVIFRHKGIDAYIYIGPRGVPAVATNIDQFEPVSGSDAKTRWLQDTLKVGALDIITLPFTVSDPTNSSVYYGGDTLVYGRDYTLAGDTLTFVFTGWVREVGDGWSGLFKV